MEVADDGALFKVPGPDTVEPQYPFTSEDTIRLHTNRILGADDSSSLFVNTDDGGGSEADQNETENDGDKSSVKNEPMDETGDQAPAVVDDGTESTNVKQETPEEPPAPTDPMAPETEEKISTAVDDPQRLVECLMHFTF